MKRSQYYDQITSRIVARMETSGSNWLPSWTNISAPHNVVSKWRYRGINTLMLWLEQEEKSYRHPMWATYRQWASINANVKKGEKGTPIVFFKKFIPDDHRKLDPDKKPYPIAKVSHVYNTDQVEGYTPVVPEPLYDNKDERDQDMDSFITLTEADIATSHAFHPCYMPKLDTIHMPEWGDFPDGDNWYSTLFHELGHWTGAENRLDRKLTNKFKSEAYAAEELIAELTSAFVGGHFGLETKTRDDHAMYLNNWIRLLKDDHYAIATASKMASEAAEHLLDLAGLSTPNVAVGPAR